MLNPPATKTVFTVLCDVDGVVTDPTQPLLDRLFMQGLGHVRYEDIKHHDFRLSLNEIQVNAVYGIMGEPGFCYGLAPCEGAFEFVDEIAEEYQLLFVTSPYPSRTWVEERRQWVADKLGVPSRRVLSVASEYKHHVRGEVLIEDRPDVLASWCAANPAGLGLLMDRPWNQTTAKEFQAVERHQPAMWRVESYDEALEHIHDKYAGIAERVAA